MYLQISWTQNYDFHIFIRIICTLIRNHKPCYWNTMGGTFQLIKVNISKTIYQGHKTIFQGHKWYFTLVVQGCFNLFVKLYKVNRFHLNNLIRNQGCMLFTFLFTCTSHYTYINIISTTPKDNLGRLSINRLIIYLNMTFMKITRNI